MKMVFLGDVFCENAASLRCWPQELHADACVFNFEYVHDNGALAGADAAEGKINLKGMGNPFLPGFGRYVACLANNHVLDYTDVGVESTLGFIRSKGADVIGVTHLESGQIAPFVPVGDGVTVAAYLQRHLMTNVLPGNKWRQIALDEEMILRDARAAHDAGGRFHVAFLHWGTELLSKPWPNQVELAHRLIDSGLVQMVVGMHSHCIQSYEIYRGRHIFYGLGNCVFPDYKNMPSRFAEGVSGTDWQEAWPTGCNHSLAVLLNVADEQVDILECDYQNGRLTIEGKMSSMIPVDVTREDIDTAVARRVQAGQNLLMQGREDLAQWHFSAAIRSRVSYMKGLGEIK